MSPAATVIGKPSMLTLGNALETVGKCTVRVDIQFFHNAPPLDTVRFDVRQSIKVIGYVMPDLVSHCFDQVLVEIQSEDIGVIANTALTAADFVHAAGSTG